MKKLFCLIPILYLFNISGISQKKMSEAKMKEAEEKRILDTLRQKLSGVKYLRIIDYEENKEVMKTILGNAKESPDLAVLNGLTDYAVEDLKLSVVYTDEQTNLSYQQTTSFCDYVNFAYSIGVFKRDFGAIGRYPLEVVFVFCDNSKYYFKTTVSVNGTTNYRSTFRYAFKRIVDMEIDWKKSLKYDVKNRLSMKNNPIVIKYNDFLHYLDTCKTLNKHEGVYELISSDNNTSNYKLGIYRDRDSLKVVYFSGSNFIEDWEDGELKGILTPTKSETDFLLLNISSIKVEGKGSLTFTNENAFEVRLKDFKGIDRYIRLK